MTIQTIHNNLGKAAALAACSGLLATQAGAAPRIDGPATRECRDTLAVADTAFHSTAFRLDDAIALPRGGPVRILSQRQAGDISGGDGVAADSAMFKTLPPPKAGPGPKNIRGLYWQVTPTRGIRWVIADEPFNWRGDFYSLFAMDPAVSETEFVPPQGDKDPRVVLRDEWMPPVMLRDRRSGEVWAVTTETYGTPGLWTVYSAARDGVKRRCTILFGPRVKTAADLLPAPLRALAADLDGTMGDGRNEGTLEPTATLRGFVAQGWVDAVLRPWAVTTKPYNTRRDADLGLRRWSYGSPGFRALYRRIQADYPAAVDALADLYVRRFGKTPEDARKLAVHNLDIVYRSHFVFPRYFIHPAPKGKPAA